MTVQLVIWCAVSFFVGVLAGTLLVGLCVALRSTELDEPEPEPEWDNVVSLSDKAADLAGARRSRNHPSVS